MAEDHGDLPDAFPQEGFKMRGRLPLGPECVEHVSGSTQAKERAKAIYETMTGRLRVQEACRRLGISEPRFDQLRSQMVTASVEGVESRPAGRPARRSSPEEQRIRELEAKLAEAELKLRIAQAREEIALALPSVVRQPSADHTNNASDQEKKTRRRQRRARARLPASRNT